MIVGLGLEATDQFDSKLSLLLKDEYGDIDPGSPFKVVLEEQVDYMRPGTYHFRYFHALQYYGTMETGSSSVRHIAAGVLLERTAA